MLSQTLTTKSVHPATITISDCPNHDIVAKQDDACAVQPEESFDYKIRETLMGTKRKLKMIFMGAGCSGINFASQLQKRMENIDLTIYEKNHDFGCACDIPSVSYQYTWARKPDWSQYYSGAAKIHQYFKSVALENNVQRFVKFSHKIVKAEWLDDEGKWKVTIMKDGDPSSTFVDYTDFFINGGGFLNSWKWSEVKTLHTFKGPLLHTANWDETVELKDKKVLVLGIGSSGVQVIPAIIDRISQLFVVARSTTWITAGFAPKYAETKERFRNDPDFYLAYCKAVESELNQRFRIVINESVEATNAREYSTKEMSRKLAGREDLIDHLMPKNFGIGCRRPTLGNGFLESLVNPKTITFKEELAEITPTGFIAADGSHHECDIIICATGFDTSFRPQFPILCNGRNKYQTISYFAVGMVPLAMALSVPWSKPTPTTRSKCFEKAQVEDIKKIQVKRSAAEQFSKQADEFTKRTAYSDPCSSWFKAGDKNRKPAIWPGSRIQYLTMLQKVRFEDYEV
ncbi:hypothetical protein N7488_007459 [Penicillium malachiteum]|nr:hypothetical protein N7488_007459 [Penicillium malachiteum]